MLRVEVFGDNCVKDPKSFVASFIELVQKLKNQFGDEVQIKLLTTPALQKEGMNIITEFFTFAPTGKGFNKYIDRYFETVDAQTNLPNGTGNHRGEKSVIDYIIKSHFLRKIQPPSFAKRLDNDYVITIFVTNDNAAIQAVNALNRLFSEEDIYNQGSRLAPRLAG